MKKLLVILFIVIGVSSVDAQKNNYKKAADELYGSIQKNFYIKDSGYYREEAIGKHSENPISFMWPLCAMIQAANEMDIVFPKHDYFTQILDVIEKYKDQRPPVLGYASYKLGTKVDDRYYDDNQWIGIASLDAYSRTKNKKYLQLGTGIYRFMMSGYDTVAGGGIYWVENNKNSKNACSNGPGVLVALGMYEATKDKKFLDTAILIYDWTVRHLRSPNGLYYDNYNIKKHKVDSALYSYNAGTMLESSIWLYSLTNKKKYLEDANLTAKNAAAHFLGSGYFKDDYWFNAVMLRGYLRLYKYNKDVVYIELFKTCLDNTIRTQKHSNGLYGKNEVDNLVKQGGLLEMFCRMAEL